MKPKFLASWTLAQIRDYPMLRVILLMIDLGSALFDGFEGIYLRVPAPSLHSNDETKGCTVSLRQHCLAIIVGWRRRDANSGRMRAVLVDMR